MVGNLVNLDDFLNSLSADSPRDSGFTKWKNRNQILVPLMEAAAEYRCRIGDYDLAEKIYGWADAIKGCCLRVQFKRTDSGRLRLNRARFCGNRMCLLCSSRKRKKKFARFKKALESVNVDAKWIFLTLSARNCEVYDLKDGVSFIRKGYNKLVRGSSFNGKGGSLVPDRIKDIHLGSVLTLEITRRVRKDGSSDCHPHFHGLFLARPDYYPGEDFYVGQDEWVSLWGKALGVNYLPAAYVRFVKSRQYNERGFNKDILETFKYGFKPNDFATKDFNNAHIFILEDPDYFSYFLSEFIKQTQNIHFIQTYGICKDLFKSGFDSELFVENENEVESGLEDYLDLEESLDSEESLEEDFLGNLIKLKNDDDDSLDSLMEFERVTYYWSYKEGCGHYLRCA